MTLNDVTNQQVRLAHNLIAHLGYEGIRLLGLHYASEAGSGLNYYLSTVMLATEQDPLDSWGPMSACSTGSAIPPRWNS